MNKKKLVIIILLVITIVLGIILYICFSKEDYSGNYEIGVSLVDSRSPDRILMVYKNGKKTEKYEYIKYNLEEEVILCKSINPTVNYFDIEKVDNLIIVFKDNSEVIASIRK